MIDLGTVTISCNCEEDPEELSLSLSAWFANTLRLPSTQVCPRCDTDLVKIARDVLPDRRKKKK